MVDVHSKERRSYNMSKIRGKDTTPERALRSALHHVGLRYRLHQANLPGKPDIVLPRSRVVVLVHGCFWHRHAGCRYATTPATNAAFWQEKFTRTMQRDKEQSVTLAQAGWRVVIAWECEIAADVSGVVERVRRVVLSAEPDRLS